MDDNKRTIASCTCPDFVNNQAPCKHLYVVERVLRPRGFNIFLHVAAPEALDPPRNTADDIQIANPEAMADNPPDVHQAAGVGDSPETNPVHEEFVISRILDLFPAVRAHLDADRIEREEQERQKREREVADALKQCDDRIDQAFAKLSQQVKRRRVCGLAKRQDIAALFERFCHEFREVYNPGAGRRCQ